MRVLKFLFLAPLAALILIFAYANREWVTINFDPIGGSGLTPLATPQYVALLVAMALASWSAASRPGSAKANIAAPRAKPEPRPPGCAASCRPSASPLRPRWQGPPDMRFISAEAVDAALDFPALVDALDSAFPRRPQRPAAPPSCRFRSKARPMRRNC